MLECVNVRHLNTWYLPCGSFSGSLISSAVHLLDRLFSYRMRKDPLRNIKRGKYFRIAADIIIDDESLGDILLEAGVAVHYNGGKKTHKWCD